jgi:hypothetical protein
MKRTLLMLVGLAALSNAATANPACVSDTIANYIKNYTTIDNACQVGDKLFYAFLYSGTAAGTTAPTSSQVTVVGDSSNVNEPGLVFSSTGWTVSGTSTFANPLYIDSNIAFTVAVVGLQPLIIDASLDFANHFNVSGQGVAVIGETVTLGSTNTSTGLHVDSSNGPYTSVNQFSPVSFVRVNKDLIVEVPQNIDAATGTATIMQFREGFSEMPEPVTCVLFGSGLLGLGLLRRRRA